MAVARKLPNTNLGRERAIDLAALRQSAVPVGGSILHPTTETRLAAMKTAYDDALADIAAAQANLSVNTPDKTAKMELVRTVVSQFIQVFNMGVSRNKYPAAHRAYYQLEVGSETVPNLDTDSDALLWAKHLAEGDPVRVAAGGAAMANPDLAELTAARNPAILAYGLQTSLSGALDTSQEALNALNEDADSLIKRIWDDAEAFYGEEEPASMRNNARQWGVVYITLGPPATLTGLVKNAGGAPQVGAEVIVVETGAAALTNADGRYSIETTVTGNVIVRATLGALTAQVTVAIPEEHEGIVVEVPDIVIV